MSTVINQLGQRIAAVLDDGVHPATGQPIREPDACGGCMFWQLQVRPDGSSSGRTKCAAPGRAYRRGGPNLPPSTPACALFQPVPVSVGAPDLVAVGAASGGVR